MGKDLPKSLSEASQWQLSPNDLSKNADMLPNACIVTLSK
jgi:hypothetical protein